MKVTSEVCKTEIVTWCQAHPSEISRQFAPVLNADQLAHTAKVSNWKRISKVAGHGQIERCFDCRPLDDQLRAYVYTDASDTAILRITVVGE